ncbi:MAG: sigma 54-interacting transcriptional regulator [Desulfobacteraceae bacterium]
MTIYTIPDPETLKHEIAASHERCRRYGIDPMDRRNPKQKRLSPQELEARLNLNRRFLKLATQQIQELYQFVAGAGFAVNLADKEGYILHSIGDPATLEHLAKGNCTPGYRWTERDVGTSVVSLSLARRIPVQINEAEHFCQRGHGFTCSACPVLGPDAEFIGVIAMSGDASNVHPHTLGMVITAAKAIENQLRVIKTSDELQIRHNYTSAIIDSIDSGVLAIDRNGKITQANQKAQIILDDGSQIVGRSLASLFGDQIEFEEILRTGTLDMDREVFIRGGKRDIQLLSTAKPITDKKGESQGVVIIINEINRIRKLVHEMAGLQARFTFEDIIGLSPVLEETKKLAMLAAVNKSTVLLKGETGTGKELFSQAIHNHSDRRGRPFVAINCGAIPRELLESELFGYAGGAFTGAKKGGRPGKFELANGGTVFLDEIGDMPSDMQIKLLRVLQTGEINRVGEHKSMVVDVRIIAATHVDLDRAVANGSFREDLFYRLNVFPILIPPLRERGDDVLHLGRHFLGRYSRLYRRRNLQFGSDVEMDLLQHRWPGNVRELENAIERATNLVDGGTILPEHFSWNPSDPLPKTPRHLGTRLQKVERETIAQTIQEVGNNLAEAARVLGISRATLYNKLKRYRLSIQRTSV